MKRIGYHPGRADRIALLIVVFGVLRAEVGEASPPQVQAAIPVESSPTVREALAQFDRVLFGRTLDWFIELYDPAVGGFHGDLEMRRRGLYAPTVQATCQVLSALRTSGLLENMPDEVKRKIVAFIQSNQDPATGMFWDKAHPKVLERRRDRNVTRTTGFALRWLAMLGAEPLHPLPSHDGNETPRYLRSLDAWKRWLHETMQDRPGYGNLDDLGSQAVLLNQDR